MKHIYQIQNIRCGGCGNTIAKALSLEFESAIIDVAGKTVTVELKDESEIAKGAEMLKKLGYPLSDKESGMVDKAKSFVSCAIGKFGN
jgi:copper chaperone